MTSSEPKCPRCKRGYCEGRAYYPDKNCCYACGYLGPRPEETPPVPDSITNHADWHKVACEFAEIEQVLGKALGYPPNPDNQPGVCVGEHTPVTLAMEAAKLIDAYKAIVEGHTAITTERNEELQKELRELKDKGYVS